MKSEKAFIVKADSNTVLDRLIAGMPKLGYRQVGMAPLEFERGSKAGRWLSLSMSDWKITLTIRLEPALGNTTDVSLSVFVPYAIADEGTMEGRRVYEFWNREMNFVEAIAQGSSVSAESYHGLIRGLADREIAGLFLILMVLSVGGIAIGLASFSLGLLSISFIQYATLWFAVMILFLIFILIYNIRQRRKSIPDSST